MNPLEKTEYNLLDDMIENISDLAQVKIVYSFRTLRYLEANRELLKNDYYKTMYNEILNYLVKPSPKRAQVKGMSREFLKNFSIACAIIENEESSDNFVLTPQIEKFIMTKDL